MKKTNSFISSSGGWSYTWCTGTWSSVTSTFTQDKNHTYDNWSTQTTFSTYRTETYSQMTQSSKSLTDIQTLSWETYESTAYEKIEYFLEATQKLNEGYSNDNGMFWQHFAQYDASVAIKDVYNGFIDLVITFPVELRLAGIQLINPWANATITSDNYNKWRYLPSTFKIYKVNHEKLNDALNEYTYENDVAKKTNYANIQSIRPINHMFLNQDEGLTLLGSYDNIYWNQRETYDCFFKFNSDDEASINSNVTSLANKSLGTATWKCKQLVLRIFKTKINNNVTNIISKDGKNTNIENLIYSYILEKEKAFGTTFAGNELTIENVKSLIGVENISNINNPIKTSERSLWNFKGSAVRSYNKFRDLKFESGIKYKIGGIQPLFSPDVFSISEMKMYDYAGNTANKVYIGEWDPDDELVVYYGTKAMRISEPFDIGNVNYVEWNHNFNVPTKYLDCKVFAKFKMGYDTFKKDDIISNLVTIDKVPLSVKITNNKVTLSLAEGVGFTNPETGEFISFKDKFGIQMDRPGNYDSLVAAMDTKATIESAGSTVSTVVTGDCPFQLYFVVKRLF